MEVLDDAFAYVTTDGVGVPGGPGQQMLLGVRAGLPDPLCDGPAVLAWQVRQQTQHQPPGSQAGSYRANRPAIPPMATSNASRHRTGSML